MTPPESRRRLYLADLLVVFDVVAVTAILWFAFYSEKSPLAFITGMQHVINEKKHFFLYELDHHVLAKELREFAQQEGWKDADFNRDDPKLPASLRNLKPSAVYMRNNHIIIDFGGPFNAMDLRAFKPGVEGYGNKKIEEGFWFYARDGKRSFGIRQ